MIIEQLDLFAFEPVPKKQSVISTKISRSSSVLFILFVLTYTIVSFVDFCKNNVPILNQIIIPQSQNEIIDNPPFAIQFMINDNLNQSFYNEKYFTFSYQQMYKNQKDPKQNKQEIIDLNPCPQLSWVPKFNNQTMLCPKKPGKMQGFQSESDIFQYTRLIVQICNNITKLNQCANINEVYSLVQQGRIFLYTFQPGKIDHSNGQKTKDGFLLSQTFLTPSLYNRKQIVYQQYRHNIYPDYLKTFDIYSYNTLYQSFQTDYVSQVQDKSLLFQFWFCLDHDKVIEEVVYKTIIFKLSQWAAFFNVLFTCLVILIVSSNAKKFYQDNLDWNDFKQVQQEIKNQQKKTHKSK